MTWTLLTAPDERDRCWVVVGGSRCERPSAIRIGDGSRDGYTFTCWTHAELVLASEPGCISEPVGRLADAGRATCRARAAEIPVALIAEIRNALVPAQYHLQRPAADSVGEAAHVEFVRALRRARARLRDAVFRADRETERRKVR